MRGAVGWTRYGGGRGVRFGFGGVGHTVVVGSRGVALPAGKMTFLLTDVGGSTVLWETRRAEMGAAIARHYDILDEVIGAGSARCFDT